MDACSIFTGIYISSVYKTMALKELDDRTLTVIGALGGLANGLSRLMWGLLYDKYGFKPLYTCVLFA